MAVAELPGAGEAQTTPGAAPRRRRGRALAGRLGSGIGIVLLILLLSSFITYGLGALSDSDPAATILGQNATPAQVAKLNRSLGLDKPLAVQYWDWLTSALHGDFGVSYFTGIPVSTSIVQRLPVDLSIAILAVILAAIIGGVAGTCAAIWRGSIADRCVTIASSIASTLPAFVIGIVLVVIFAVGAKLLPANGYVSPSASVPLWLRSIILPSFALSLQVASDIARQLRTSLVSVLEQNYVTGARVRGLPYRRVLFRHALRNAIGPALTVLGNDFPMMLAGAVAAEEVFSLPGLGQLLLTSAQTRDIPVVQGVLLVVSAFVVAVNIVINTLLNTLYRANDGVGA
ncbi:MAG TPA: ABC transporter permease [Trebonia sp.]